MKSGEKGKYGFDLSGGADAIDVEDFLSGGRLAFEKPRTSEGAGQEALSAVTSVSEKAELKGKTTDTDPWVARTVLLRRSVVERLEKVAKDEEMKVSQVIRSYISRGLRRASTSNFRFCMISKKLLLSKKCRISPELPRV
jgi:hypothetical protein